MNRKQVTFLRPYSLHPTPQLAVSLCQFLLIDFEKSLLTPLSFDLFI